jgi:hypothetical protein
METITKKASGATPFEQRCKEIKNHKEIAAQLKEAARLHLEAATLLENDYHERAFQTVVNAFGFLGIVREAQKKIINDMV